MHAAIHHENENKTLILNFHVDIVCVIQLSVIYFRIRE